jgi:hypothetical protein
VSRHSPSWIPVWGGQSGTYLDCRQGRVAGVRCPVQAAGTQGQDIGRLEVDTAPEDDLTDIQVKIGIRVVVYDIDHPSQESAQLGILTRYHTRWKHGNAALTSMSQELTGSDDAEVVSLHCLSLDMTAKTV